jgi:putative acetyltransferase
VLIRLEEETDCDHVYGVHVSAFPAPSEAILVNALRARACPIISLVAEEGDKVIGHIMFSPITLSGNSSTLVMGLAPMAVVPDRQNQGVGSELVLAGLEHCRRLQASAVVVLGHPEFYPRFGFLPSSRFGIDSEYEVPEEVFMAMELVPGALGQNAGRAKYHAAFEDL